MKLLTQNLSGAFLDAAVAMSEGHSTPLPFGLSAGKDLNNEILIERMFFEQGLQLSGVKLANGKSAIGATVTRPGMLMLGDNPTTAALRCHVCCKLGPEVDIPDAWLEQLKQTFPEAWDASVSGNEAYSKTFESLQTDTGALKPLKPLPPAFLGLIHDMLNPDQAKVTAPRVDVKTNPSASGATPGIHAVDDAWAMQQLDQESHLSDVKKAVDAVLSSDNIDAVGDVVDSEVTRLRNLVSILEEGRTKPWALAKSLQAQVDILEVVVKDLHTFEHAGNWKDWGSKDWEAIEGFIASAQGAMRQIKLLKEGQAADPVTAVPTVVVVVEGGNVQYVSSNMPDVCVIVHDDDNLAAEGLSSEQRTAILDCVGQDCRQVASEDSRDYAERLMLDGAEIRQVAARPIVAMFTPQAWIDDYAVDVDGSFSTDVTRIILAMQLDEIQALQDSRDSTDVLVKHSHTGPFRVSVTAEICQFFGVSELKNITQSLLERGRAGMDALMLRKQPFQGLSIQALFVPQVKVGTDAVHQNVDQDHGFFYTDVTHEILAMDLASIHGLWDGDKVVNKLVKHAHDGPFEVRVAGSISEYFEVEDPRFITQEMLDEARQDVKNYNEPRDVVRQVSSTDAPSP